jgi:hypothetical protein
MLMLMWITSKFAQVNFVIFVCFSLLLFVCASQSHANALKCGMEQHARKSQLVGAR